MRYLKLITEDVLKNKKRVLQLMRWRIKNQRFYPRKVKITEQGFRKWLTDDVFNKTRFLFWVLDNKKRIIGQMGLYRFKKDSCEIDSVIRGTNRDKGRMSIALQELIRWSLKHLPIQQIYLRVLSTNKHAILFYKRNKFIPLGLCIIKRGNPQRFLRMKYSL
jgi:RimJ/RimL family protein N-acetyltransferase